ncbi:MAG: GNAT family N-acetyltransferase [Bacteroidetes bacterium]|nr:GNAT family N-acetyltransferase [Bacteroidota bacterium]
MKIEITEINEFKFIAQTNDMIVGYMMILIKEIQENAFHYSMRRIHINQLAAAEKNKGTGVGAMLIEKVEEIAQELNINRLELDHLDNNLKAKKFFHARSFFSLQK